MQNLKNLEKKVIGVITGGWCGLEVIDAALSTLEAIDPHNEKISLNHFKYNGNWEDTETDPEKFYPCIKEFYKEIKANGGAVLRGSVHAPIVYKLRRDFEQLYKLVPLNHIPELLDASLLKKEIAQNMDILLVRENCHGPYHAKFKPVQLPKEKGVNVSYNCCKKDFENLANISFELARKRRKRLHDFMKTEVMGDLGQLWLDSFESTHQNYPDVKYSHLPMGSGASEIFYKPKEFDVIVTGDVEGDIIADQVPRVLYGSLMITPSGNFSLDGFASYQTVHGTIKPIAGKDMVNPTAMIRALGMCLNYSFGMKEEADMIEKAIRTTITQNYRTRDIYRSHPHKLIGTKKITREITSNIKDLIR